jgi:hypothetical protein
VLHGGSRLSGEVTLCGDRRFPAARADLRSAVFIIPVSKSTHENQRSDQ